MICIYVCVDAKKHLKALKTIKGFFQVFIVIVILHTNPKWRDKHEIIEVSRKKYIFKFKITNFYQWRAVGGCQLPLKILTWEVSFFLFLKIEMHIPLKKTYV